MLGNIRLHTRGYTMKRNALFITVLATALAGCAGGTPSVSPSASAAPVPSPSPSSSPVATPTPTPAATTNASCHELAFYLDPILASGFTCETVPAATDPVAPHPEHTRVTLTGYAVSGSFLSPRIFILPVADYAALEPARVPGLVADLQAFTASDASAVFTSSSGEVLLPFLPEQGAMQMFFSQYELRAFESGLGHRYITELGQSADPISNDQLIYTFQGLTSDGQYWVSAILPISNTLLPANANDPPAGQTWDQFFAAYETYMEDTVHALDAQPPTTFEPLISTLDVLAASITISP